MIDGNFTDQTFKIICRGFYPDCFFEQNFFEETTAKINTKRGPRRIARLSLLCEDKGIVRIEVFRQWICHCYNQKEFIMYMKLLKEEEPWN